MGAGGWGALRSPPGLCPPTVGGAASATAAVCLSSPYPPPASARSPPGQPSAWLGRPAPLQAPCVSSACVSSRWRRGLCVMGFPRRPRRHYRAVLHYCAELRDARCRSRRPASGRAPGRRGKRCERRDGGRSGSRCGRAAGWAPRGKTAVKTPRKLNLKPQPCTCNSPLISGSDVELVSL